LMVSLDYLLQIVVLPFFMWVRASARTSGLKAGPTWC
jgi:hypothetical protein